MNINELRTKLDNEQMKLDTVKEQVAFTNSEFIILDDYTIETITYDSENREVRAIVQKKEKGVVI